MRGNIEMTRIFLEYLEDVMTQKDRKNIHGSILWHAAQGNQISTVEIGLEKQWLKRHHFFKALESTTSLDILKRLLDVRKHCISPRRGNDGEMNSLAVRLRDQVLDAAARGDIPLMEYLARHSARYKPEDINKGKYDLPISRAAKAGRYDVVKYLIELDVGIVEKSIVAAAKHGSRRLVQLLLEKGTWNNASLSMALARALERENDSVVGLLIEYGVSLHWRLKYVSLSQAEIRGQETMATLIRERI